MKKFIKNNKSYLKSIIIVLLAQTTMYFFINILVSNFNILKTNFNIPLIKGFIYIYHSWYPIVFLTSYLIYKDNEKNYKKLIFTFILSFLISHLTFILFPTKVIRPIIEIKTFTDFIVSLTYKLDNPTNCLPSIHALVCFISIYYVNKSNINNNYKILTTTYFILIIFSTLFTKQHLPIDLLLALIYSIITIIIVKIFYSKLKKAFKNLF